MGKKRPAKSKQDIGEISRKSASLYEQSVSLYEQYAELLRLREEIKLLESTSNNMRRDKLN